MAHFTTSGKRYREGTGFAEFGGADVGVPIASVTTYQQTAPASLPDGTGTRQFLFWDTGRRVTNKRTVRWTFSNAATWTSWNAVAWYGTPGGGGGAPVLSFDAYWVGAGSLDPTPIDGPGSTFVDQPGGSGVAWPWEGNDKAVGTQWGPATVRALDHLQRSSSDPVLDFSSLTQLLFGGDDSGVFEEDDSGITTSGGVTGVASTTAQQLTFAQGSSALVLAAYVQPTASPWTPPSLGWIDKLIEVVWPKDREWFPNVDPSPDDLLRLKLLAERLDLVRRGPMSVEGAFEGLASAAKQMSQDELTRTVAATRAAIGRGEAALKSLEAMLGDLKDKRPDPRQ